MQDRLLLERAAANRRALGPFEAKLWSRLSRSQLAGFKFRRQHVIGGAIVDFFCPAKGLIIEIDGDTHDQKRDADRDEHHTSLGYATLRFGNDDIAKNLEGVLTTILSLLQERPDRWFGGPHPYPSPEGEGIE